MLGQGVARYRDILRCGLDTSRSRLKTEIGSEAQSQAYSRKEA